jgi:hypothetical protein
MRLRSVPVRESSTIIPNFTQYIIKMLLAFPLIAFPLIAFSLMVGKLGLFLA